MKFLHAADIHLDSPLKGLERYEHAPVDRIRNATRRTFERLVELAVVERVDFVLLAGDLYDGDWRDYNTGLYLNRQLGRLADEHIPVLLISGNHDADNKMTRSLRLPPNVTRLASDRPQSVVLDDLGVAVHGQSYAKRDVTDDLACKYPTPVPGLFNIGLLHTGLGGGFDGHEPYAPCTVESLRTKGYDYWALGHIHKRQAACEDPLVVFPGNLQGRHIRESGPKGAVLVEADRGSVVEHAFRRLDVVLWESVTLDGAGLDGDDALLREASARLLALRSREDDERLVAARLIVRGRCPMHDRLQARAEELTNELRGLANAEGADGIWLEKVVFATEPVRAAAVPDGPIQEMLEVLDELTGDPATLAPELAELWQKLPAELKRDPDVPRLDDPSWIARALVEVRPVLLDLLVGPGRNGAHTP